MLTDIFFIMMINIITNPKLEWIEWENTNDETWCFYYLSASESALRREESVEVSRAARISTAELRTAVAL